MRRKSERDLITPGGIGPPGPGPPRRAIAGAFVLHCVKRFPTNGGMRIAGGCRRDLRTRQDGPNGAGTQTGPGNAPWAWVMRGKSLRRLQRHAVVERPAHERDIEADESADLNAQDVA